MRRQALTLLHTAFQKTFHLVQLPGLKSGQQVSLKVPDRYRSIMVQKSSMHSQSSSNLLAIIVAWINASSAVGSLLIHTPANCVIPMLRLVNKRCSVRICKNCGDATNEPNVRLVRACSGLVSGHILAWSGTGRLGSTSTSEDTCGGEVGARTSVSSAVRSKKNSKIRYKAPSRALPMTA